MFNNISIDALTIALAGYPFMALVIVTLWKSYKNSMESITKEVVAALRDMEKAIREMT